MIIPNQAPISLPDDSMFSTGSDVRRNTLYQRPGPPTPGKHSARLSVGGSLDMTSMSMHTAASKPQTQLPEATSKLRAFFTSSKGTAQASSATAAAAASAAHRDHQHNTEVSQLVARSRDRSNTNPNCTADSCGSSCSRSRARAAHRPRGRSPARPVFRCARCALHMQLLSPCEQSDPPERVSMPLSPPSSAPSSSLLSTYLLSPVVRFVLALLCTNRMATLVRQCWHCVCMVLPAADGAQQPQPQRPPLMLCCPRCSASTS